MIFIFLLTNSLLLGAAIILSIPSAIRNYRKHDRSTKLLLLAWSAMVVGQFVIFKGDSAVQNLSDIGANAYYQLGWMAVSALLVFIMLLRQPISVTVWRFPLVAFVMYIFVALISAGVSDSPLLSFYRAGQLLIDLALVAVAYTVLKRTKNPQLLVNITFLWLVIFIFSVVLGGIILPEQALVSNKGVLGVWLFGSIFYMHPDSLGLLAAVGFLVSILRVFGGVEYIGSRFLWFSFMLSSGTVLILAQARTSIAGCAIALFIAGIILKKMRWLAYVVVVIAIMILFYYWLSGASIGFEQITSDYLRRGVSDDDLRSMSGRTGLWDRGWGLVKDSPFLGHGFGSIVGGAMHSAHMGVMVNVGFLGYMVWLVFVFGVALFTYKNTKLISNEPTEFLFSVTLLLVLVIYFVRSFLGYIVVTHQLNMMIFLSIYVYAAVNMDMRRFCAEKTSKEQNQGRMRNQSGQQSLILAEKNQIKSKVRL